MARKRYTSEQIIGYLREAEVLQAKGSTIGQVIVFQSGSEGVADYLVAFFDTGSEFDLIPYPLS